METIYQHPNVEILRAIYSDLSRIGEFLAEDVVLHLANRGLDGSSSSIQGKQKVQHHEQELIRLTNQTLFMDVENIIANDYFGSVIGVLRAQVKGTEIAMPFCGLWRFVDGFIVEHWENAYEPAILQKRLLG